MLKRKYINDFNEDLYECKELLYKLRRILIENKERNINLYNDDVFYYIEDIKKSILYSDIVNSSYSFYNIETTKENILYFDLYHSYLVKLLLEISYLHEQEIEKIRDYFSPIGILKIVINLDGICKSILNIEDQ